MDEAPTFPIMPVLEMYGADPPSSGRAWAPLRCPFHGTDRRPSAAVNRQAQRFICHVCMERSEDAIGLVMWHEQLGFKDAVAVCESVADPIGGEVRGSARGGPRGGGLRGLFE